MMGPRWSEEPEATGMVPGAEVEVEVGEVVVVDEGGWLVEDEVGEDVVVEEESVGDDIEEDMRVEAVDRSTVLMEMRVSENRENGGVPVGRPEGLPSVAVAKTVVPRLLAVPHPNMDMPPSKKFW